MTTDKEINIVLQQDPEWIFEVIQMPPPSSCQFRSEQVKALARTMDHLAVDTATNLPFAVLEYQMQDGDDIFQRTVEEMCAVQRKYGLKLPIEGIVFLRSEAMDPDTYPWNHILHVYVLRDEVEKYEKAHPDHPMVATLKPLTEKDRRVLAKKAKEYYTAIRESTLSKAKKKILQEVFEGWMFQRFKDKEKDEVAKMFIEELTPIEETVAGRQLIEIGMERAMKRDAAIILERLFKSTLPETLTTALAALDYEQVEELNKKAWDFGSLEDVSHWLEQQK